MYQIYNFSFFFGGCEVDSFYNDIISKGVVSSIPTLEVEFLMTLSQRGLVGDKPPPLLKPFIGQCKTSFKIIE